MLPEINSNSSDTYARMFYFNARDYRSVGLPTGYTQCRSAEITTRTLATSPSSPASRWKVLQRCSLSQITSTITQTDATGVTPRPNYQSNTSAYAYNMDSAQLYRRTQNFERSYYMAQSLASAGASPNEPPLPSPSKGRNFSSIF